MAKHTRAMASYLGNKIQFLKLKKKKGRIGVRSHPLGTGNSRAPSAHPHILGAARGSGRRELHLGSGILRLQHRPGRVSSQSLSRPPDRPPDRESRDPPACPFPSGPALPPRPAAPPPGPASRLHGGAGAAGSGGGGGRAHLSRAPPRGRRHRTLRTGCAGRRARGHHVRPERVPRGVAEPRPRVLRRREPRLLGAVSVSSPENTHTGPQRQQRLRKAANMAARRTTPEVPP